MFLKISQLLARIVVAIVLVYLMTSGFDFSSVIVGDLLMLFYVVVILVVPGVYPFKEKLYELYKYKYLVPSMNFLGMIFFIIVCYLNKDFSEKHILLIVLALFIIALYSTLDVITVNKCRKMIAEA